jgi:putative hemolysin
LDDPLPSQLFLQFVLILLNAFFACAEIAVISLNDAKVKRDAEAGDKRAMVLVKLTSQPARFLATIQVGITFAGFLGSAFAAENFSDRFVRWLVGLGVAIPEPTLDAISVVAITLLLSYFTLVLGELVPKRIAMQKAEAIAKAAGRVIYFLSKVTAPVVWLLTISTNGLLRLLRINPNAQEANVTEEEIRIMVDLGEEKGAIAPEEGVMIDNVLELSNKMAVEIMTHRTDLTVLWLEDTPEAWEEVICNSNYSRYPVCDESMDDIVGILHVRDYFCNKRKAQPAAVKDVLNPAFFVPETVNADVLFREMKQRKTHIAVVVDEYGGTSGVITLEDLLEQIVGEIEDEHDENEDPDIQTLEPNRWRVRGSIDISTLSDELCVTFPEGDYDTLGGLIFAQMNSIPEDGAHPEVDIAALHMRVEEILDHRIEWVEISAEKKDACAASKQSGHE